MKKFYVLALILLAASVWADQDPLTARPPADASEVRYNQVQWLASHNSYAQKKDILGQLKDWRIHSIEFDIHTRKKLGLGQVEQAAGGDWQVYHTTSDEFSNCNLLSKCFAQVMAFHQQDPRHDVITIFFDMEGVGEPGHTRDDLYALFEKTMTRDAILKPGDLLAACPGAQTLQEAVTKTECGWPRLSELQGKFILVVSDGREAFEKAGYDIKKDLIFLVNKNGKESEIFKDPRIVFFNMSGANSFARAVGKAGLVSRCYWLNRESQFTEAKQNGANHLATDKIDPALDPWSVVSDGPDAPYHVISR